MALTKIPRPAPMGPCTETAQLAADLMALSTSMHKLHLKITGAGSYAVHKALNEFYDEMPDKVDAFVEQYQGAREKLLDIPESSIMCNSVQEALAHMRMLYERTTALQAMMPFSEVTNQLDEVKSLISSTKYKLMFLS